MQKRTTASRSQTLGERPACLISHITNIDDFVRINKSLVLKLVEKQTLHNTQMEQYSTGLKEQLQLKLELNMMGAVLSTKKKTLQDIQQQIYEQNQSECDEKYIFGSSKKMRRFTCGLHIIFPYSRLFYFSSF